ncbi:MAG: redox-regulated ATPase YchF [Myxococcota bacterium]
MAINIGIVGLPNVGKSTLFNALSKAGAESANFPFCTIEPNVGVVPVPDARLDQLASIYSSESVIPASLEFVDIAGLVKGASQGEGLGNQFLSHIRQVHAVAHVVRCFVDENVVHVDGSVDPVRDVEVIDTELLLADLDTVEKRLDRTAKAAKASGKQGDKAKAELAVLQRLQAHFNDAKPARTLELTDDEALIVRDLHLITRKPVIYVGNVSEEHASDPTQSDAYRALSDLADTRGAQLLAVSAAIESEVAQLDAEEAAEYLESMGLEEPGLHRIIKAGYATLGLITFLTAGPKESRAWPIREGTKAPGAAGSIHTDFERGFIKAEVMRWEDLVEHKDEAAIKAAGKLRIEGKEYVVKDGDVMHFRFNV